MKFIPGKLMHQVFGFVFLLAMWVMLGGTAMAQNQYYVNAGSGSDSNDGSQARPWKTLSHADSAAVLGSGGTVIHVAGGTYSFAGSALNLNKGGTSDSVRMVWQCDNQSNATMTWPCLLRGGDGSTGVNINGTYTNFVGFDYSGSSLYAVGTSANFVKFLNNRVHDTTGTCAVVGGAGIVMGSNSHDGFVVGNWIFNITAGTPSNSGHCHGIYNIASNTTIENNVIFNNPNGMGIKYEPSATVSQSFGIISNNLFWGNGRVPGIGGGTGGCIYITGNPSGGSSTNMTLNNNVCYLNPGTDAGIGFGVPSSSGGQDGSSAHNNLMNGNGNQTVSGGAGTVTSTPNFTNFQSNGSGDYTPTASGVLTHGGSTVCASSGPGVCVPSTDFVGVTRLLSGSILGIGAFEQGSIVAGVPSAPTGLTATVQ